MLSFLLRALKRTRNPSGSIAVHVIAFQSWILPLIGKQALDLPSISTRARARTNAYSTKCQIGSETKNGELSIESNVKITF
ncbi:hypothetical protein FisN_24Lu180 [Fistulifera solaris]|uniref:Uncharacterized protein n=1 Tax=Fistulifera solaris TaxID=1519565 RepID=A0A1Z5K994_FISSO|nr:hypothetical protein FisN_24Lu180 [Fistulifera solaris]|eukprot:GAX22863.1 hypothetical protein FisN_24Lu180 [Fistulifera solaris]